MTMLLSYDLLAVQKEQDNKFWNRFLITILEPPVVDFHVNTNTFSFVDHVIVLKNILFGMRFCNREQNKFIIR